MYIRDEIDGLLLSYARKGGGWQVTGDGLPCMRRGTSKVYKGKRFIDSRSLQRSRGEDRDYDAVLSCCRDDAVSRNHLSPLGQFR